MSNQPTSDDASKSPAGDTLKALAAALRAARPIADAAELAKAAASIMTKWPVEAKSK